MPTDENFTEIETLQFEGMTFASVYDLVMWLRDLGAKYDSEENKRLLSVQVSQLSRLVTK